MPSNVSIPQAQSVRARCYLALAKILGNQQTEAIDILTSANLWAIALPMAGNAMIISSIAWQLRNYQSRLPEDVQEYLDAIHILSTERNERIVDSCSEAIKSLNEHEIFPLALKGSGLLLNGRNEHISVRMQSDIDLLIPEAQLMGAADILVQHGYQFAKQQKSELVATPKPVLKRYSKHLHLPPLIKIGSPCSIELHRHCVSRRFAKHFDLAILCERSEHHSKNGIRFHTFNDSDQIKHYIYHDFIGGGHWARKELPLRLAMDINTLKSDEINAYHGMIQACTNHLFFGEALKCAKQKRFYKQMIRQLNEKPSAKLRALFAGNANKLLNLANNPGKIWQLQNY